MDHPSGVDHAFCPEGFGSLDPKQSIERNNLVTVFTINIYSNTNIDTLKTAHFQPHGMANLPLIWGWCSKPKHRSTGAPHRNRPAPTGSDLASRSKGGGRRSPKPPDVLGREAREETPHGSHISRACKGSDRASSWSRSEPGGIWDRPWRLYMAQRRPRPTQGSKGLRSLWRQVRRERDKGIGSAVCHKKSPYVAIPRHSMGLAYMPPH